MARRTPPRRPSASAASGTAAPGAAWEPCPTCWGQRRILVPAGNGEGLVAQACHSCLGIGERPAEPLGPAPSG